MTAKPFPRIIRTTAYGLAFGLLTVVPAKAQDAPPEAPQSFEECAGVPDDVERLACYDEVATAVVPDTVKAMREAKIEQQQREFGLIKPGPGEILDELPVKIVSWRRTPLRKVELTTEQGAVWVQTDTKTVYYPSTLTGVIKKGLMGSYFFSPDDGGRPIKVERKK